MTESRAIAKQAIRKLEDQLTCAICLDDLKDPKLLQCFHVYCKDCLQQLVVKDHQGQLSLSCPTCRQSTVLPQATGVSGLQSAFHIHHLLEIKDALEKVKEPQKVKCGKCRPDEPSLDEPATSYCRDCGKFMCAICTTLHKRWDDLKGHEVVAMEQFESKVKQLNALNKVHLYCSLHQKKLKLYCETCDKLICSNCIVKIHRDHRYDLVSDTFEKHKAQITASLDEVEEDLGLTNEALEQLDVRSQDLDDQQAAIEESIQREKKQLIEVIEARATELIGKADSFTKIKKKNLAAQRDELETIQTQLSSCLSFVRDSLKSGSEGEVMKMKIGVMKQIKEMTDNFKPDVLPPCENANVKFTSSLPMQVSQLQQFGDVSVHNASLEKCSTTSKVLETAEPNERAIAVVNVNDSKEEGCPIRTIRVQSPTCELVSDTVCEKEDCSLKKTEDSQDKIRCRRSSRRRHRPHIKVEVVHVNGNGDPVTVKLPGKTFGAPIKTIDGVKGPCRMAVNKKGEIIVSEGYGYCVSIFSSAGEKLRSFDSRVSGHRHFNVPQDVAVDDDGNILVVYDNNSRIHKFTSDGKFIVAVGRRGNQPLEFINPIGIAIHPLNKKVYVADCNNHRIQILNPDLTFSSSFGSHGSDNGQFQHPWDVAFDSKGNVYVADAKNRRIQVFTAEGEYLRKFGNEGSDKRELNFPSSIAIYINSNGDSDRNGDSNSNSKVYVTEFNNHRVSVFTCEGEFLASFGSPGYEPGQFINPRGVKIDQNGMVYVCDYGNNRLQYF